MNFDKDVVEAAARGNWISILTSLGIDSRFLTKKEGPCPVCGGKERFSYDNKYGNGNYFCNQCRSGTGFRLLMNVHGWTFPEVLRQVAGCLGMSDSNVILAPTKLSGTSSAMTHSGEPNVDWDLYAEIATIWRRGKPIQESPEVLAYLTETRKIPLKSYPAALRCFRQEPIPGRVDLLAAVTKTIHGQDKLLQVQTLRLKGAHKVPGDYSRIFCGSWGYKSDGAAVKLAPPTESGELGLAEGIETALSANALFGVPVWACLTAAQLAKVELPDDVRKVVIFADNDASQTGQKAATALKDRLVSGGLRVRIATPPEPGTDFNDVLMHKARA